MVVYHMGGTGVVVVVSTLNRGPGTREEIPSLVWVLPSVDG